MRFLPQTDLAELAARVSEHSFEAALPSALPDKVLRCVAEDLLEIEIFLKGTGTNEPSMDGPLLLVMHLLKRRMEARGIVAPLSVPEVWLLRLFQSYKELVEIEMAARVAGTSHSYDAFLLRVLDELIDTADLELK